MQVDKSPIYLKLPPTGDCALRPNVCKLTVQSINKKFVNVTIVKLSLPNRDHSYDCLQEGVVFTYPGKRGYKPTVGIVSGHSHGYRVMKLCGKVRYLKDGKLTQDYLFRPVFSPLDQLAIIIYSFNIDDPQFELIIRVEETECGTIKHICDFQEAQQWYPGYYVR